MESSPNRKVKVKTMDGKVTEFEVDPNISVEDFKLEVEQKMNVPVNRQRLIYKSRLLKEGDKLDQHIKKNEETIHLMAMTEEQVRERETAQRRQNRENRSNRPANQN
jgi:ubiquilin